MKIGDLVANHVVEHRKGIPIFGSVQIWRRIILEPMLIKGERFGQEGIMQELPKQRIGHTMGLSLLNKTPEGSQILL